MRTLANKPAYLFSDKEEIIAERNRMEANWDNSNRDRMHTLAMISLQKFGVTLSRLS